METPGARFWNVWRYMRYKHTTTVLNDSGSEKKQPENQYNRTLQGYTGFRGISDGSV